MSVLCLMNLDQYIAAILFKNGRSYGDDEDSHNAGSLPIDTHASHRYGICAVYSA